MKTLLVATLSAAIALLTSCQASSLLLGIQD